MNDDDGNVYTLWVGFFMIYKYNFFLMIQKKNEIVNVYEDNGYANILFF